MAGIAAITLFMHGLHGVGRELTDVGGPALKSFLARLSGRRWRSFLVGALATAVVQSSSAVSSLGCALVNAGTLPLRGALAIVLGANVGTTATAWLVAFKLTAMGPYLLIAGTAIGLFPSRIRPVGKSIFYFGLIFFALSLVSSNLRPLLDLPKVVEALSWADEPWAAAGMGLLLTALIQSSSAVVGLTIVLVTEGALPPEAAVSVVVGSNLGSTSTALLASLAMNRVARAVAAANALFNAVGLAAFLPFLGAFGTIVVSGGAGSLARRGGGPPCVQPRDRFRLSPRPDPNRAVDSESVPHRRRVDSSGLHVRFGLGGSPKQNRRSRRADRRFDVSNESTLSGTCVVA